MGKRVLFVAPKISNLYIDLQTELEAQGYEVFFVADISYGNKIDSHLNELTNWRLNDWYYRRAGECYKKYWYEFFKHEGIDFCFDYLLVIDGISMCPYFFETLTALNKQIHKILYLFDAVSDQYRFDKYFKYFDKIYSFDIEDARKYGLGLMPIWWTPTNDNAEHYDVFGFASFGKGTNRYDVFKEIKKEADELGLTSLIKLYAKKENIGVRFIKRMLKRDLSLLVEKDFVSNDVISPKRFKALLNSSNIILDALGQPQCGMTTRFSWAIGAGKKIITDNSAVSKYSFYDPEQIWIFRKGERIPPLFFKSEFSVKKENQQEVNKFRIDNFVKTLFA